MFLNNSKRKISPSGYDIIVFDCDSTLSAVEGIDLLAERHNVKEKIEKITHKAMNGHSNFADALTLRLNLIKPRKEDLMWLGDQYIKRIIPGVKQLVSWLKKKNKNIYIISGGFRQALYIFADFIGVNRSHVFSNVLLFDKHGKYKGFDAKNPLSQNHGKRIVLKEIAKNGSILFVGDGITDLEAINAVDLFVGYGGIKVRDVVKKEADIFIESKSLAVIKNIATGSD